MNSPPHANSLSGTSVTVDSSVKTAIISTVFSLLSKLCKSKATGLVWTKCADLIGSPFCAIFYQSVTSGIIPDEWKLLKVTSLFKQGERSN